MMYPYFLKMGNNFIIFIMVLPLNKHKKILKQENIDDFATINVNIEKEKKGINDF